MPLYDFLCGCGQESSTARGMEGNTLDKVCPNCGEPMARRFSQFGFKRFQEHYSPAVGKVVSSERGFRDDLKRASEEATQRTGIPHSFVPVELEGPKEGPGTDEQAREMRKRGVPGWESKRSYF